MTKLHVVVRLKKTPSSYYREVYHISTTTKISANSWVTKFHVVVCLKKTPSSYYTEVYYISTTTTTNSANLWVTKFHVVVLLKKNPHKFITQKFIISQQQKKLSSNLWVTKRHVDVRLKKTHKFIWSFFWKTHVYTYHFLHYLNQKDYQNHKWPTYVVVSPKNIISAFVITILMELEQSIDISRLSLYPT